MDLRCRPNHHRVLRTVASSGVWTVEAVPYRTRVTTVRRARHRRQMSRVSGPIRRRRDRGSGAKIPDEFAEPEIPTEKYGTLVLRVNRHTLAHAFWHHAYTPRAYIIRLAVIARESVSVGCVIFMSFKITMYNAVTDLFASIHTCTSSGPREKVAFVTCALCSNYIHNYSALNSPDR